MRKRTHTELSFDSPLISGTLIRREHRFTAVIRLPDGTTVSAHCANPGRMEGLIRPGAEVFLSKIPSRGQLKYRWELINIGGTLIGTNSWTATRAVQQLFERKLLRGFKSHSNIESEQKIGLETRVDFRTRSSAGTSHIVEVKSASLIYPDGVAYFPDSLTTRSVRQLEEIGAAMDAGFSATIMVVVIASEAKLIRPSDVHDAEFCKKLRELAIRGLQVRGVHLVPRQSVLHLKGTLPVDLNPYDLRPVVQWRKSNDPYTGWQRPPAKLNAAWRKHPAKVRRQLSPKVHGQN